MAALALAFAPAESDETTQQSSNPRLMIDRIILDHPQERPPSFGLSEDLLESTFWIAFSYIPHLLPYADVHRRPLEYHEYLNMASFFDIYWQFVGKSGSLVHQSWQFRLLTDKSSAAASHLSVLATFSSAHAYTGLART